MIRTVFFATPDEALPIADQLFDDEEITLAAIVTRPPKPRGRGMRLLPSALQEWGEKHDVPILTPPNLKGEAITKELAAHNADVFTLFAYGNLIPEHLLAMPPKGVVNIHPSLLPRYRGSSPVQHALLNGDEETGISYMLLDEGVDTGPILFQQTEEIKPEDTSTLLQERLIQKAASQFPDILKDYMNGKLIPKSQEEEGASMTKRLTRADGKLDFTQAATTLERMIRAYDGWPGAFLEFDGTSLRVLAAHVLPNEDDAKKYEVGTVLRKDGLPALQTGDGLLVLDEVQLPGKRATDGASFLNGNVRFFGSRLVG